MAAHDMNLATISCSNCQHVYPATALFCPNCGTAKVRNDGDALLGKVLGERFLVQERLGQGTSGTIYRGEHVTLRRKVAIKVLHAELARDDLAVERFRREATMVAEVDNEHIVEIHDFGRTPDGRLYLAMELLEGETLDAVLAREGKLSVERAADILIQLGEALMEAHAVGYVHRDLRPRNVYLAVRRGKANFVKLLDFGLSKLVESDAHAASTSLGMTFGDPRYMSPEQARGDRIDRRADVYQLGCIAYEMLTGAPPFTGGRVFDILSRQVTEAPAPLPSRRPDVPLWMEAAVARMLAKSPDDRFATTSRLVEALRVGLERGEVMDPEVARQRETIPPPSVSRAMEKLGVAEESAPTPSGPSPGRTLATPIVPPPSHGPAPMPAATARPAPAAVLAPAPAAARSAAPAAVPAPAAAHLAPVAVPAPAAVPAPVAVPVPAAVSPAPVSSSVTPRPAASTAPPEMPPPLSQTSPEIVRRRTGTPRVGVPAVGAAAPGAEIGPKAALDAPFGAALGAASVAVATPAAPASSAASRPGGGDEAASSVPAPAGGPPHDANVSQAWFAEGDDDPVRSRESRSFEASATDVFADARRRRRRMTIFGGAAAALIAVGGVALALWGGGESSPSAPASEASAPAASAPAVPAGASAPVAVAEPATPTPAPPATSSAPRAAREDKAGASSPASSAPAGSSSAGASKASAGSTWPAGAGDDPLLRKPAGSGSSGGGAAPKETRPVIEGGQSGQSGSSGGTGSGVSGGDGTLDPYGNVTPPANDDVSAAVKQAEDLATEGQQAMARGDLAAAAAAFKKSADLDSKNLVAVAGLGELALQQGLFGDAIAHLRKASKLAPRSARIQTLLGEALLGTNNASAAAEAFKRALQIDPDNARAREGYNQASAQLDAADGAGSDAAP